MLTFRVWQRYKVKADLCEVMFRRVCDTRHAGAEEHQDAALAILALIFRDR